MRDEVMISAPAGEWKYWGITGGGRGAARQRALVRWLIQRARAGLGPIRIFAGTYGHLADDVIRGPHGVAAQVTPDFTPQWNAAEATLTWPNGVVTRCFTAAHVRDCLSVPGLTDAFFALDLVDPESARAVLEHAAQARLPAGRAAFTVPRPSLLAPFFHLAGGHVIWTTSCEDRAAEAWGDLDLWQSLSLDGRGLAIDHDAVSAAARRYGAVITTTPRPVPAALARYSFQVQMDAEKARQTIVAVQRLAHQAMRGIVEKALVRDAAQYPAFAHARRAALLFVFEVQEEDPKTEDPGPLLRTLHQYEALRGGLSRPRPEASNLAQVCDLQHRRGWIDVYERERAR